MVVQVADQRALPEHVASPSVLVLAAAEAASKFLWLFPLVWTGVGLIFRICMLRDMFAYAATVVCRHQ